MSDLANLLDGLGKRDVPPLGLPAFLLLLALSAVVAFVVAWLYVRFFGGRGGGSEIQRSFPLLAVAVTAIFVCIQFSLPLSLGLLGALSIVRFRTPIKEPEEIGFLMVVIATSLACATFNLKFVAGILIVTVVALLARQAMGPVFRRREESGVLVAHFDEGGYDERSERFYGLLRERLGRGGVESISRHAGVVTVTYRFRGLHPEQAPALEQAVRQAAAPRDLSLVFAATAGLP
jgi:hypothetical protein